VWHDSHRASSTHDRRAAPSAVPPRLPPVARIVVPAVDRAREAREPRVAAGAGDAFRARVVADAAGHRRARFGEVGPVLHVVHPEDVFLRLLLEVGGRGPRDVGPTRGRAAGDVAAHAPGSRRDGDHDVRVAERGAAPLRARRDAERRVLVRAPGVVHGEEREAVGLEAAARVRPRHGLRAGRRRVAGHREPEQALAEGERRGEREPRPQRPEVGVVHASRVERAHGVRDGLVDPVDPVDLGSVEERGRTARVALEHLGAEHRVCVCGGGGGGGGGWRKVPERCVRAVPPRDRVGRRHEDVVGRLRGDAAAARAASGPSAVVGRRLTGPAASPPPPPHAETSAASGTSATSGTSGTKENVEARTNPPRNAPRAEWRCDMACLGPGPPPAPRPTVGPRA